MSELIDRIFDAEKISADINLILKELGKVEGALGSFSNQIKEVEATTRKAKGADELAKNAKTLNDTVTKGGVEMKKWEAEVAKLNEKTKQLTDTEKLASIEIAKARLELQAAQKATKDAAIAEIELTATNKNLAGSYNALQKDLQDSIKAYKALSGEEAKSAKGQELIKKISETQSALKSSDASMGNYQRNVGNYAGAVDGLTPKLGGLAGTLLDIAKAAQESRDELNKMGGDNGLGVMANPRIPAGLATIMTGLKGIGQSVFAVGKALLANPIGIMIAVIAGAFALVNSAIKSNGQATEKLGQVMVPFKTILGAVLNVVGKMVSSFLDGVLVITNLANSVMSLIPGLDKLAEKNKEAILLEREKQRLIKNGIVDKAADAKEELRIAELKKKIMEKDKYSTAERLKMAREIDKAEKAMALDDADRANKNLIAFLKDMKLKGKTQKDYTVEELTQLSELQAAKYSEQQAYFDKTKKLAGRESALKDEISAEELARNKKVLDAKRRLVDSQFALLAESEDKAIKVSNEANRRKIEDLKANGELTKELQKNLTKAQENEILKIKKEWQAKELNEQIKSDELTLSNMERAGKDTLSLQKTILEKKMQAEILAGGNEKDIREKYAFLAIDLENQTAEKKLAAFEKELKKRSDLLTDAYQKEELDLKKRYANGKLKKEEYEAELSKIQLNALLDVNNESIEALQAQVNNSELSTEKRAELSEKLKDLQIANENAVTDATIKANDDQIKADELAKNKRIEIASALISATTEIFGAIGDYQNEKSQQRIEALETEQDEIDKTFEKDQENLDNAIMSDENRAAKQLEIEQKKADAKKVIDDKIQAEKVKQAKWDKANSVVQAIAGTALGIINAMKLLPPLNLIAAGLAATTGAIQLATILSTPIPAYEKGGITGDGLALWGETRPEVAVDPSGNVMLAETPTISNFDAGTRIYKSVQDYEAAMSLKHGKGFEFDYDKMASAMPKTTVELNGNGSFTIQKKRNERITMINRRTRLN